MEEGVPAEVAAAAGCGLGGAAGGAAGGLLDDGRRAVGGGTHDRLALHLPALAAAHRQAGSFTKAVSFTITKKAPPGWKRLLVLSHLMRHY